MNQWTVDCGRGRSSTKPADLQDRVKAQREEEMGLEGVCQSLDLQATSLSVSMASWAAG